MVLVNALIDTYKLMQQRGWLLGSSLSNLLKVTLHDGYGNPINSFSGALNIHDPHSHHVVINQFIHQHTGINTTLSANATAGDYSITVASATGFNALDYIHIENGVVESTHPQILSIVGNVFTLDRPIDNSFAIGANVKQSILSMTVNGSVTPQSFQIMPTTSEIWHIEMLSIQMTHTSAGDNGLFGNLSALTRGVALRYYNGTTASFSTLSVWKTNGDIFLDTGDVIYAARSGGGGSYGTNSLGNIYQTGAVLRLDGTAGDYLEFLIQDDLTGLDNFTAKVQGHIEGL